MVYENDPELIFQPNGAAEALLQAKKDGKVRFVGFTGHKDPEIHLKMLSYDFPFDTVQMGGSGELIQHGVATPAEALRYAMSLPVAVTISGMELPEVARQNLEIARGFQPMSAAEMTQLRDRCRFYSSDGRFELSKTTKKYDGPVGRAQHGFPPVAALPA